MSDDSAVVTDEAIRERLVTAISDTERTTSDFRAMLTGDQDSVTLSNGKTASSIPALVLNRASALMTRAVDAGDKAIASADSASTSASNAASSSDSARSAATRVDSSLESMGVLVQRSETSAENAQASAAEALKSQQAAEQAAANASSAALGDIGGAQITGAQNVKRSIQAWIEQFSRANIVVENLAALKNVDVNFNGQRFFIRYHTYKGYGGGNFIANTGDTTSKDNNGTVVVGKNGVRFHRELDRENNGNILLWGADPSGKNDCSQAFQNAIDTDSVRTITVPVGIYLIDKTVTFARIESYDSNGNPVRWGYDNNGNKRVWTNRKNLYGEPGFWGHFGFYSDVASMQCGNNIQGPMFELAYNVANLAFNSPKSPKSGVEYTALNMEGYVNKVTDVTFGGFTNAMEVGQAVNFDIVRVLASGCDRVLYCSSSSGINTTVNMQSVLAQYCDYMVYSRGELWGSSFQQCTWEVCNNHFVYSKTIFNCHFVEVWVERGGNGDSPVKFLNTSSGGGQQIRKCTEMGCSFHYSTGWLNPFDNPDGNVAGRFGGVSMGQNSVVVSEATGSGVRMDVDGISQMMDPWKPSKPFIIKSDRNEYGGMALILKSEANLDLESPNYVRLTNPSGGSSSTALRWPQRLVSSDGTDGNIEVSPNRARQLRMRVPVVNTDPNDTTKRVVRQATGFVPFMMRWSGPYAQGQGRDGFELFDQCAVGSDNTISLQNNYQEFSNPFIFCECEDADIKLDRWDAISSYSGSWNAYKICKGVKLYFRRISTGELVAPSNFAMMFATF